MRRLVLVTRPGAGEVTLSAFRPRDESTCGIRLQCRRFVLGSRAGSDTPKGRSSIWQSTGLQNQRLGVRVPPPLLYGPPHYEDIMNRELRRLQEKEEKRARDRRGAKTQARRNRERVGLRQFVSEVRTELKRVAWPSRREVITFTAVTLITSVFVTAYAFGLDLTLKRAVLELLALR